MTKLTNQIEKQMQDFFRNHCFHTLYKNKQWRTACDYLRAFYDITETGVITKRKTGKVLKVSTDSNGAATVAISGKPYQATRIMWLYHHGRLPETRATRIEVKDGNKTNIALENLHEAHCSSPTRKAKAKPFVYIVQTLDGKLHPLHPLQLEKKLNIKRASLNQYIYTNRKYPKRWTHKHNIAQIDWADAELYPELNSTELKTGETL